MALLMCGVPAQGFAHLPPPTTRPYHLKGGSPHTHKAEQRARHQRLLRLSPRLAPLLKDLNQQRASIEAEWIKLTQIPAPSRHEQRRAAYLSKVFRRAGLQVSIDNMGNVLALRPGTEGKRHKGIVICAHMDTVFGPNTPLKITRKKQYELHGPGILDDTVGLINLLTVARLFHKYKLTFKRDIWFVGTVQEELGLHGSTAFLKRHRQKIGMVISLDGGFGGISYGALGIEWYKLTFSRKRSFHTLSSQPNIAAPTHAVASTIHQIYQLPVYPRARRLSRKKRRASRIWYNVSRLGGGQVVNAQPAKAWFTIDLRAMQQHRLNRLRRAVFGIAHKVAWQQQLQLKIDTIQTSPAAQLPGMRSHVLVQTAALVLRHLGVKQPRLSPLGASDHCPAIALGIPGINIGTIRGGHIHSLKEYADTRPLLRGITQSVLLLAMLADLTPSSPAK